MVPVQKQSSPPQTASRERLGEFFYRAYYPQIRRYFSFRVFDKSEAEDLAQTVFLKILVALKKGCWSGANGLCYIFIIARNTLIDYFRRKKHSSIVSSDLVELCTDSTAADEPVERYEKKEFLLAAMQRLRAAEVQAVLLRFFSDMEYSAIAKIMHKSEEAVRQLVHRGIKTLRGTIRAE